jgi:Ca2+-binding EF-hand superfamily protein
MNTNIDNTNLRNGFELFDRDSDGKLDFQEFVKFMMAKSSESADSVPTQSISANFGKFAFINEISDSAI